MQHPFGNLDHRFARRARRFALILGALGTLTFSPPPARAGLSPGGYTFTTIDAPGATGTYLTGINDSGQIVGTYFDASGTPHLFLDTGGSFTPINVPGAVGMVGDSILGIGANITRLGINDSGQIVGSFYNGSVTQGFLDTGGSFTTIAAPGADFTEVTGISNDGRIVGISNGVSAGRSFIDTGGSFTPINVPNTPPLYNSLLPSTNPQDTDTSATGINNSGEFVGGYFSGGMGDSYRPSGFFYDGTGTGYYSGYDTGFGKCCGPVIINGVNDEGQFVGYQLNYNSSTFDSYDGLIGGVGDLNVPTGAEFGSPYPYNYITDPYGINDDGDIVGVFEDDSGVFHGFLAAPDPTDPPDPPADPVPEPGSLALFASGLIGLLALRHWRKA